MSVNIGLQLHLQTRSNTASKCISTLTPSQPESASPNLLYHGLEVHLCVHSISASKCISKLARSQCRSVSMSSLDLDLEVHPSTRWITALKYIINEWRRVYGETGVTELDWAMGCTFSGNSGVDRYHLIFISSGSTQLRGFSQLGSIISCDFLPQLLELEPFLLTNSIWMLQVVWQNIDGGQTAV